MSASLQKILVAALAFLIVFGSLCYGIYANYTEKEAVDQDIQQANDQIAGYEVKIAQKPKYQKIKDDIEDNFTNLVEVLPQYTPKQGDRVLDALTAYAAQARMDPKGVNIASKREAQFEHTLLSTRWQGKYADLLRFINAIENNPSFLRIDEVSIDPVKAAPGASQEALNMSVGLKISTFAYQQQ